MNKKFNHLTALGMATSLTLGASSVFADSEEWEFSVAPLYLWGKAINATATAGGKELPLDLEFKDDILENLESAFSLHAEASKGDLTFFLEYNYANLDPEVETSVGPVTINAGVDFEDTMSEGGIGWAFADTGATSWELLGGLRYYKQKVKLKLSSSLPIELPIPNQVTLGDSWVQPFVGVRLTTQMTRRWSFRARADYGYEGSDNTALQGLAFLDYRFRDWGSAFFGYRYLDMDYSNAASGLDQYGFDGDQQGPLVGLNFHF